MGKIHHPRASVATLRRPITSYRLNKLRPTQTSSIIQPITVHRPLLQSRPPTVAEDRQWTKVYSRWWRHSVIRWLAVKQRLLMGRRTTLIIFTRIATMMTIILTRRQTCFAGDNTESKSVNKLNKFTCLKMNSTVTVTYYDCTGARGTYPNPNYKKYSVADPGLSCGGGAAQV